MFLRNSSVYLHSAWLAVRLMAGKNVPVLVAIIAAVCISCIELRSAWPYDINSTIDDISNASQSRFVHGWLLHSACFVETTR